MKTFLCLSVSSLLVVLATACNFPSKVVSEPSILTMVAALPTSDPVYLTARSCYNNIFNTYATISVCQSSQTSVSHPNPSLSYIDTVVPGCDPHPDYLTAVACTYGTGALETQSAEDSAYYTAAPPCITYGAFETASAEGAIVNYPGFYSWGDIKGDSNGRCMPTSTPTPIAGNGIILSQGAPFNRCSLFSEMQFSLVTLDWQAGQPLEFYIKMPGGVPGLEKTISQDTQPWNYSVNWGDFQTQDCKLMPGLSERLYCSINMPAGYANTSQTFELHVNSCDTPVYQDFHADIPSIVGSSSSHPKGVATPTIGVIFGRPQAPTP